MRQRSAAVGAAALILIFLAAAPAAASPRHGGGFFISGGGWGFGGGGFAPGPHFYGFPAPGVSFWFGTPYYGFGYNNRPYYGGHYSPRPYGRGYYGRPFRPPPRHYPMPYVRPHRPYYRGAPGAGVSAYVGRGGPVRRTVVGTTAAFGRGGYYGGRGYYGGQGYYGGRDYYGGRGYSNQGYGPSRGLTSRTWVPGRNTSEGYRRGYWQVSPFRVQKKIVREPGGVLNIAPR